MSEYIEVGQPLQFTDPNTPTRVGEIVENVSDIYNIPSPRLGMQVFVKSEKKSFVITSLKSKVIGGVDVPEAAVETFEPVGAKSITWNNDTDPSNINDFVVAGVYNIKGERTRVNDNLPILNTGGGHSFNARLTVLDSSISGSGKGDDKCITQVLSFSNRLGQGEVYIRTGKGSSLDNLTWDNWSTLQRNVNVGSLESKEDLRNYIDNGIYSGVFRYGSSNNDLRTFVMVVINDYAIGLSPRRVSQFLYSIDKATGKVSYETQTCEDETWKGWEILNKGEIDSMISNAIKGVIANAPEAFDTLKEIADWIANDETGAVALANAISANTKAINTEATRAKEAEEEISHNAIAADTIGYSTTTTDMSLEFETLDGKSSGSVTFPSATTEQAGVMSAADKEKLDNLSQGGGGSGDITALRSLFVAAGAEYNNSGTDKNKTAPWGETVTHKAGHYYLNGLGDITEEEMIEIYNAGRVMQNVAGFYNSNTKIRTNLPSLHSTSSGYSRTFEGRGMFLACTKLEVAIISINKHLDDKITAANNDAQFVFLNCPNVRYISRLNLDGGISTADMFRLCSSLRHVEIKQLSTNLSFSDSPLIDKESILYLIQNNKAKSAITITLHADAYARLANDADILAALEAQPLVTLVSA